MHLKRLLASITMFIMLVTGMPIQACAAYDAGTSEVQLGETTVTRRYRTTIFSSWSEEKWRVTV